MPRKIEVIQMRFGDGNNKPTPVIIGKRILISKKQYYKLKENNDNNYVDFTRRNPRKYFIYGKKKKG